MKFAELSLKTITIIQLLIALGISLLFQFVIPYEWQPLNRKVPHFTPGENIVFFTVSQWFFSFAIAWFIKKDNPYVNSFLIFSFVPVSMMTFDEIFRLGIFYDYYHLLPFSIDIYILVKRKDTIDLKLFLYIILFISIWLYLGYFLKLAYYAITFQEFLFKWSG